MPCHHAPFKIYSMQVIARCWTAQFPPPGQPRKIGEGARGVKNGGWRRSWLRFVKKKAAARAKNAICELEKGLWRLIGGFGWLRFAGEAAGSKMRGGSWRIEG